MADYKIRIIVEGEDRASGPLSGAMGSLQRMGEIAGGIGITRIFDGLADGVTQFGAGLADAVVGAGNLEAQLDGVGALAGATTEDMAELRELLDTIALNPNLKVNMLEASDAAGMLIRNGLTLQDVMSGALESTVLLANSTGAGFDVAADISTDAMAIFGIESENMMQAVDGITGTVSESKFTIDDYGLALGQAGAIFAGMGFSLEEFNAVLVATDSNFNSGSDSGTSMKTMFQRLIPTTKEQTAALEALGIEVFDQNGAMKSAVDVVGELNDAFYGQVQFSDMVGGRTAEQSAELKRLQGQYKSTMVAISDYQAGIKGASLSETDRAKKVEELTSQLTAIRGAMEPLAGIQGEMVSTTRQLTDEERLRYLNTIFGMDGMRTALGLAGMEREEFAALQTQLGETDALQIAAQRVNNLSGDLEVFGGIVEAVKLSVGDMFQAPARAAVQGLTQLVTAATPILLDWADQAAAFVTPYVEGIVTTLTDPAWQADVSSQVTAFWKNYTTNNRIAFNLGDVLEVDFSLDGAGEGITKFTLADFFDFYSVDGTIEKIYLDQVVDFTNKDGITKLSILDIFDMESTEGGPIKWNVKDLISFEGMGQEEFTLTIGAFEYTSQPEGNYTVTGWTINGQGPGDLLSEASRNLGAGLADLSATSGFDALLAKLAEPITMTLTPEWQGESPEAQLNRVTGQTWTVKVLGTWELEVPEWLKIGSTNLLVHLKAEGLPGLGSAAAGAVAGALGGMNWSLKAPEIDWSFLEFRIDWETTGFSEWFQGQSVDAPKVEWEGAGFSEWFAAQTFTLPLPGALSDGVFTIEGADVLNSLKSWSWPEMPSWSWPALPKFSWPAMPSFSWPALPAWSWPSLPTWSWPSLPSWSWPDIPVPGWLSWLTGGGGNGGGGQPPAATGGRREGRTWVGEFGPELVDLPRGSYVHTAGASRRLASAGGVQQVFHFAPVINTPLDMEEALRRLADLARRRGGG